MDVAVLDLAVNADRFKGFPICGSLPFGIF